MSNIGVFAVVLGVVLLVWARASMVVFALFYTEEMPSLDSLIEQILTLRNLEFFGTYVGVGLVFATIAFAASVVSVPLMLDRNQDAITAMLASFGALLNNPGPMLVWAALIVILTADRLRHLQHRPGGADADHRPRHLARLPRPHRATAAALTPAPAAAGGCAAQSSVPAPPAGDPRPRCPPAPRPRARAAPGPR
jgi:hypothetical protein